MPNFENPNKSIAKDNIKSGFETNWLEDDALLEKARELADFYIKEFQEFSLEVEPDEEILIHFTASNNLSSIFGEQNILNNNSPFYDCDRNYLVEQGFDYDTFQEKFGSPNSLVAIPLKSFLHWVNTKSWIKLTQRGTLENAVVFVVSKKEIILRDHKYLEKAFDSHVTGKSRQDIYKDQVPYYNSTDNYSDDYDLSSNMWEAWVPHAIKLVKYKIINHKS